MSAVPYNNPALSLGGGLNAAVPGIVLPPNDTSVFALVAFIGNSTNGNYLEFVKMGGTQTADGEQYQVPANKVFRAFSMIVRGGSGAWGCLGYGTAALTSDDTATPPTGAKHYGGAPTRGMILDTTLATWPIPVFFPASSFPFLRTNAAAVVIQVILIGREMDA